MYTRRTIPWGWRRGTVAGTCLALILAGCTNGSTSDPTATSGSTTENVSGTTAAPPGDPTPTDEPTVTPDAGAPLPVAGTCPPAEPLTGPSATLEVVQDGGGDSPRVSMAIFPLPDSEGKPWSQWGLGVVLPDGRFVSAVGNHFGVDGNSWVFEFDPATQTITRTADVLAAVDHRPGDWGYGKVHGRMVAFGCDVHLATYWGSRKDITYTAGYTGDRLLGYDAATHTLADRGVPVPEHGIPSLNGWAEGGLLYGEAVDPTAKGQGNDGAFFVWDTTTDELVLRDDDLPMASFRDVMVDADGRAWIAAGDGGLHVYDPETNTITRSDVTLPGDWLRASTVPAPDGTVYGATREPDALFALDPDGTVRDLGRSRGYVAAMAVSPDGRFVYYVPEAHGASWKKGTPLIRVDTATGADEVVVELDPLGTGTLDLRLGGTYDLAIDHTGTRIYIGLNASGPDGDGFGQVVLAMVELPGAVDPVAADSPAPTRPLAPPSSPLSAASKDLAPLLAGLLPHGIAAGDVNDDGFTDLFVGSFADRAAREYGPDGPAPDRLLLGGPDGFSIGAFPEQRGRTSGAAFADLDGDGDLDLVAVRNVRDKDNGREPTTIFENDNGTFRVAGTLPRPKSARHASPFDADGDGDLDLLLTGDRFGPGDTRLWLGDGKFGFTDGTASSGLPDGLLGLAATTADLSGDGLPDILVSDSTSIFLGGADGRFTELKNVVPPWRTSGNEDDPAGIAVADIDGDGRLDVVVGQHNNSTIDDGIAAPIRLYRNVADGGGLRLVDITDSAGLVPLMTKAPNVEIVDVDADGWPDIVTSARVGGRPAVFMNTGRAGSPSFTAPTGNVEPRYWVTGVTTDLDGDGALDITMVEFDPSDPGVVVRQSQEGGTIVVDVVAGARSIGSVVRVYESGRAGDVGALVAAVPVTADTGYAAGRPTAMTIGIGDRRAVDVVVTLRGGQQVTRVGVATGTTATIS